MGHLGHLKQEYADLVERLDAGPVGYPKPASEKAAFGWREILEILYTPEEAALAARLPLKPSGLGKIAAKLKLAPEELKPRLDRMADKGLVMDVVDPKTGKTRYLLSPPVVGFFEFSLMRAHDEIPRKKMAEALRAYTHGDETFAREAFGHETMIGRAMVHETAIGAAALPDVLPWERATELIEGARSLAVALCYCRHKAEHLGEQCDSEMDNCLSLDAGAEFIARRGFGWSIERSEALEILHRSREAGLVQIADNVQRRPSYLCNCCGCCCGQLQAINEYDLPAVNPSRFLAEADDETCVGCQRCSRACPIAAISMVPRRERTVRKNQMRPVVEEERCIGCGVCATACGKEAMRMRQRAEDPDVPLNSVDRVIRQSLERGRLGQLIFDGGESLGASFLGQAVDALCRLPGAERALASRQVRSRFLGFALGRTPGRR
ncbi:MAG: 4Fe-4S dicluster domain-containing protein [Deltaproteobacteria bacterium]|nr:4Fe-4S dicluster domain-containing protein [Deltaproteobacteria bacterium]